MIKRNDLCSCGSGKKYKKCCLNKDMILERSSRKVSLSQQQYAQLYAKLYEYSRQSKFYDEYKKAKDMFYIVQDEEINTKFEKFFNTYFIEDHIMESKKVITVDFYEENKANLSNQEIEILKSLFESYVSIYEVKEKTEEKIVLNDMLVGNEVEVDDLNLLKDFNIGDSLIARVITVNGTSILLDVTVSISDSVKEVIANDITHFFNQYKDVYKDIKTFLLYHTHILYKYIQQLLEPKVAEYLKSNKKETNVNEESLDSKEEVNNNDCKVELMLKENVEEEYVKSCLDVWNAYKLANNDIKGAENGWAAAVEYHVKKENDQAITQAQIAKKYGVSSSTLGKRYKDIKM